MKKINKLLIPIVGLSTITVGVIPITSCGCSTHIDGVEVTQTEWKNAFSYLGTYSEETSWKTQSGDKILYAHENENAGIDKFSEYYDVSLNEGCGCYSGTELTYSGTTPIITVSRKQTIKKNNFYFTFGTEATRTQQEHYVSNVVPTLPVHEILTQQFSSFAKFSDFKWDSTTNMYKYAGLVSKENPNVYLEANVKFDTNKKISYINSYLITSNSTDYTSELIDVVLHPQYENVKPDVKQEYIDKANAWTVSLSGSTTVEAETDFAPFVDKSIAEPRIIGLFTLKSSNNYNDVQTHDNYGGTADTITGVYKNNKLLVRGVDYSATATGINFFTPITPNDVIEYGFIHNSWELIAVPEKLYVQLNLK